MFFGDMVNFQRTFLPNATQYEMLLNAFIKGNEKTDQSLIVWTKWMNHDFEVTIGMI